MFFSKIYGSWKDTQKEKYASMLRHFPEIFSGRILDIGSGPGYLEEFLAERNVRAEVVALDMEKGRNVGVVGDGNELPFKDKSFDKIISIDAMHLIKSGDFARVLKENGLVLFTIFFNSEDLAERKKMLEEKIAGFDIVSSRIIKGTESEYVVLAKK